MRRKSHSQWQQEQAAGEPMPRDPQELAQSRLLRDTDKLLEQADEMDDSSVKRDLINRAAMNCLRLCISMEDGDSP